jgi:hypothetical protein
LPVHNSLAGTQLKDGQPANRRLAKFVRYSNRLLL